MNRVVLAAALALVASPAFAHAHLLSERPAANATVAAPKQLVLTFSESVELKFTGIKVTGPNNTDVALGTGSLDPKHDTILMVPLTAPIEAGAYTVAWHALSKDGHKTTGTYGFTVE